MSPACDGSELEVKPVTYCNCRQKRSFELGSMLFTS